MSDGIAKSQTSRRALLLAGGVAAASAAASVAAPVAEAANGGAVLLGHSNAATATTSITGTTNLPAFTVYNVGLGVGGNFLSKNATCLSGVTSAPNAYGLYISNNSTVTGNGAAVVALGTNNTGAVVSTNGNLKYALSVKHGGLAAPTQDSVSGGAFIEGGLRDGAVGQTHGSGLTTAGITGIHNGGGAGVYGFGAFGVQGYTNVATGAGMLATGDGAGTVGISCEGVNGGDALEAIGTARVTGDLYVTGTIYCNNPIAAIPVGGAAARIQRKAGRTALRLRGN